MYSINQSVGLEEDLSVFRDTERAQFVYVSTPIRRRLECIGCANETIENVLGAGLGIVLSDVIVDLFEVTLCVLR